MGSGGSIFTSLDGDSWSNLSLDGLDTVSFLDRIIWTGTIWVAFGRAVFDTIVITSPDGAALTRQTPPGVGAVMFAASGLDIIIGAGETGFIVSTNDGIDWNYIEYDNPSYTSPPIAFGNNIFLTAQSVTHNVSPITIQSSTDGTTWTDIGTISDAMLITNLKFLNGHFYLLGQDNSSNNIFWKSDDGASWSEINLGDAGGPFVDITFGNSLYIAIPQNADSPSKVSSDGNSFSEGGELSGGATEWTCLAFGDGIFVASSTGGELATTTNGASWTPVNPPDSDNVLFAGVAGR